LVVGKKIGKKVPSLKLYNGKQIPVVGLGTFGSDHMSHDKIGEAVKYAIENGYRLIDCAKVYCNEPQVGKALKAVVKNGTVTRKDLIIISKLANQDHGQVEKACRKTLKDLQLDYLDMYMVHWPVPNCHPPGCTVDSLDPNAVPFEIDRYMKVWT
jgi:diketogulonate reductase-like aldo/keto reductase